MQTLAKPKPFSFSGKFLALAVIIAFLSIAVPVYYQPAYELKMEKNSGKNGKHSNPKAREQAEQEYQKVRKEYDQWDRKPNKTPEDKEYIKKLRKLLERLRSKKDFSGENHSQKHKGF